MYIPYPQNKYFQKQRLLTVGCVFCKWGAGMRNSLLMARKQSRESFPLITLCDCLHPQHPFFSLVVGRVYRLDPFVIKSESLAMHLCYIIQRKKSTSPRRHLTKSRSRFESPPSCPQCLPGSISLLKSRNLYLTEVCLWICLFPCLSICVSAVLSESYLSV